MLGFGLLHNITLASYRLSKAPPFENGPDMEAELVHQQEHQHSYACSRHRVVFRLHFTSSYALRFLLLMTKVHHSGSRSVVLRFGPIDLVSLIYSNKMKSSLEVVYQ
ncbi:hypothetical protein TWF217_004277 [Orbilia oligospora]|nr:hypothetical protein TWF217_004277 [Orbilia oligospora]